MSIEVITDAIVSAVSRIVEVQAVYTYPVAELGRRLPALSIVYEGMTSDRAHADQTWRFEFTVFLAADGKRLEAPWAKMLETVQAILQAFYDDPTLGGSCWRSLIESGEAVIHAPSQATGSVQYIGHSFRLVTQEYVTF